MYDVTDMNDAQFATFFADKMVETVVSTAAKERHGFLTVKDIENLVLHGAGDRKVLIRCGAERYLVPAHKVAYQIAQVESRGDYVRDVSLPSTDPVWNRN